MVNVSILVGRVSGVVHTERNDLLIVDDLTDPKYPTKVACEFYGEKPRALLDGIENGDLVQVSGTTKSRMYQEKWFTSFSAYKLKKLPQVAPAPLPPALDNERFGPNDITPF